MRGRRRRSNAAPTRGALIAPRRFPGTERHAERRTDGQHDSYPREKRLAESQRKPERSAERNARLEPIPAIRIAIQPSDGGAYRIADSGSDTKPHARSHSGSDRRSDSGSDCRPDPDSAAHGHALCAQLGHRRRGGDAQAE